MERARSQRWIQAILFNVTMLAVGLATGILAARLLGPDGRGALAAILFWPQFIASLAVLGVNESLAQESAKATSDLRQLIGTAVALAFALAALGVLVGYLVLPKLMASVDHTLLSTGTLYLGTYLPAYIAIAFVCGLHQGALNLQTLHVLRLLTPLIYLLSLLLFTVQDALTVTTAVYSSIFSLVVPAMIALGTFGLPSKGPDLRIARSLIAQGLRIFPAASLVIVGGQVDRLVVVLSFDAKSIGLYFVAFTYAFSLLGVIAVAIHTVAFAESARAASEDERRRVVADNISVGASLIGAIGLILAALSQWLVPTLFGLEFTEAGGLALLLVVACMPLALRHVVVRALRGSNFIWPGLVAELIAIGLFAALAPILIQIWALHGIAVALLTGNTITLVFLSYVLRHKTSVSLVECLRKSPGMLVVLWRQLIHIGKHR